MDGEAFLPQRTLPQTLLYSRVLHRLVVLKILKCELLEIFSHFCLENNQRIDDGQNDNLLCLFQFLFNEFYFFCILAASATQGFENSQTYGNPL